MVLMLLMLPLIACTSTNITKNNKQESLLVKCEPLPSLNYGDGTTVFPWSILAIGQYNECATVHNGLVDSILEEDE